MIFDCQIEPLDNLSKLALFDRHSVLIAGQSGTGKTFLSRQYANLLSINDFVLVQPKVADIREALDTSMQLQSPIVLSIENLDLGVAAAAYTLLKSFEDPAPNVYIVITCRNLKQVPDTIISRAAVVNTNIPREADLHNYTKSKDEAKFALLSDRLVYRCAKSFSDIDKVLAMTSDQVNYYESLVEMCTFKDSISNLVWTISHYKDNQPCDIELAIRAIMELMHNNFITKCGIECLRELSSNRIAQHAVLAKFLFNAKYCE